MRKLPIIFLSGTFVLSLSAAVAPPVLADEVEDQVVTTSSDMLHFVMTVRWGNVEGEVTNSEKTVFDGAISVPEGDYVSLRRTMLFDYHDATHDAITSSVNPVSWSSYIYGHWDGVRVAVSAKASDTVTIATEQGTLARTAEEFFESSEPIVQDVGSGREIVVKTHPLQKRVYFLVIGWGKLDQTEGEGNMALPILNFSGSIALRGGSEMKLIRPLRFEFTDAVGVNTIDYLTWTSYIRGGVDGLLVRINLDKTMDASDVLSTNFPNPSLNFSHDFSLLGLYHNRVTKEPILIDGQDQGYGVVLRVWEHPYQSLIRATGRPEVWLLENGMRRHIISADAFNRAGLDWNTVAEVPAETVAAYPEDDASGYEDGMLIKGSAPTVFALSEGKKRPITSPTAFERLGYQWRNIVQIPDADLVNYPDGSVVNESADAPEGSLIRVEGLPTVYQIKGGKRLPIPSLAVFSGNKFGWEVVMVVRQEIRDQYPEGEAVGYPDGTLLASEDGRVHVIENGRRRWVRTATDFAGRGYRWGDIKPVSNQEVAAYESGDDVELEDVE